MKRKALLRAAVAAAWIGAGAAQAQAPQGVDKLSHILVLYMENRSFDTLFGEFPGANGLASAGEAAVQRDREGKPYAVLPATKGPFDIPQNPPEVRAIPSLENLPNKPFRTVGVRPGVTIETHTRDLIHAFYTNRSQINGGRNDWFALFSNATALAMSTYAAEDMKDTNLWRLARENTLLDNFFMGAFGGSFLNHIWLVCACAPVWPDPPRSQRSEVDPAGHAIRDRRVVAAGDGDYAVNTTQSIFLNDGQQGENMLPPQHAVTIGDRLTEKGVALGLVFRRLDAGREVGPHARGGKRRAGKAPFVWHHQPFAYFARFDPTRQTGRDERTAHLKDASVLEADIRTGKLPPVAFYKPIGVLNQHPGYANLVPGDEEIGPHRQAHGREPDEGHSYAVVITYDENGGLWDHAAPPSGSKAGSRADFFGPGTRVPTIVASPFARKGQVDHTGVRHHLHPQADRRAPPARRPAERAFRGGREPRQSVRFRETVGGPKASGTSGTDPAFSHHGGSPRLSLAPPQLQAKV